MEKYELRIKPSAKKEIDALPKQDRQHVVRRIQELATDPRPTGCLRLAGSDLYRIRQGNYRIIYSIDQTEVVVVIVKVGHRRDVYKRRD